MLAEYQAIVGELRGRGIRTFPALQRAAEAEAAQLRAQLQTGGRMPQLLADIDAALAKARA